MLKLTSPLRGFGPRVFSLLLIAPILVAACAATPVGQAPVAPTTVTVAPATVGSVAGSAIYSGNAESRGKVSLLPRVAGQITVLNVDVGSAVKKGDVIAELEHAMQDAQISQAQAGVEAAQVRLATIKAGPRAENVAQAKANLQAAGENLLYMSTGGRPENVTAAQAAVNTAAAKVASLQYGRADTVAAAQANLQVAQSRLQDLKNGPTPERIHAAQVAIEQAKDATNAANATKDAACNPASPHAACQAAQAAAFTATTGIDQAIAQLNILTTPPTAEQLKQAQAAVDAAQAQVSQAQHPGSSNDVAAAQGAVQSAQAQLELAKSPFSSADLAKAQAAVDIAEQQVKLAQTPYTKQDEDAAKAAVDQADAALSLAKVARDQAIVTAPIDGVVAQKLLNVGSVAAPTTPIVVLIDPSIDVVVNADAAQSNALKVGDAATITADAIPGKTIPAKITLIAPVVDPQARSVQIKIMPTGPESGLKDGMLAQVTFVTGTHEGVVVVPSPAIVQRNGQTTVFVVADNVAKPMTVKPGLTDGTKTEIVSGLQTGQIVVVSGQDRLSTAQPVQIQK